MKLDFSDDLLWTVLVVKRLMRIFMFGYVKSGIRIVYMCQLLSVFALMLLHMCVFHINNVRGKSTNADSHNKELIKICARA